uniref:Uncharacterized protein LOC111112620 isoform X7 n=1 Tax=Crassostrea virginica TaxID=6565 RepID=A0A8B8BT60_CRAVI|nr:uncharacterized protein LOC111112620 isoform X7 [Crassostrea virginica]XP_022306050.1 uncharacterized protein LOC111112620 isoform X7 [Crassostrea virginica]
MALRVDVNKGPFTLTHDPRPRDLKTTNNTSTDNPLYQDFRFKGYPSESFISPHNPQYKRNSAAEMNGTETSRYFGKTQHFDTAPGFERAKTDRPSARPHATPPVRSSSGMDYAKPKIDEGHRSLQYGSGDPRIDESQQVRPGPMRGFDNRGENDRDKLRKEMIETEQDRQRIKYQEQLRMRDRDDERKRQYEDLLEQKRQDMEMLKNYNPWGRPGGGAPMADTRKQKFTEHQLEPPDSTVYKDKWEPAYPDLERIDFRKEIAQDRVGYDPSGPRDRTRIEQMNRDPEMQQKQESLRNQEEKLQHLKEELDHLKAAATDRRPESFQERRQNGFGDSYERGGNPRTAPDTYRSTTNPFEEYDNLGRTGKPRKPNMEMHPIYHPFGRSGGGAPVKDDTGRVNTILHGHSDLSDYEKRQNASRPRFTMRN